MMEWTDRHFRWVLRRLTRGTLLYTEMVTAAAVVRGNRERLLGFHPDEHPVALQLGGDDPELLAAAARIGVDFGYDEINLNIGCPSPRVQRGNFGACLMAEPELVAEMVARIRAVVPVPVTVKHRIGIEGRESYEDLSAFVGTVSGAGCDRFIVHARIAVLGGLSPEENRRIPPLRHEEVYRLKRDFPHLTIEINGGVRTLEEAAEHLRHVDGVMIGRPAYEDPFQFREADALLGLPDSRGPLTREELVAQIIPYVESVVAGGGRVTAVTRHLMGIYTGRPGARMWRRVLSEKGPRAKDGRSLLEDALASVQSAVAREPMAAGSIA